MRPFRALRSVSPLVGLHTGIFLVVKYVRYQLYLDDHFSHAECNNSFQTIIFAVLIVLLGIAQLNNI